MSDEVRCEGYIRKVTIVRRYAHLEWDIRRLREEGQSLKQLARNLDMPLPALKRFVKVKGIKKPASIANKFRYFRAPMERMLADGVRVTTIARHFDLPYQKLWHAMDRWGLKPKGGYGRGCDTSFNLRIMPDMYEYLTREATETSIPVAQVVRDLLAEAIDRRNQDAQGERSETAEAACDESSERIEGREAFQDHRQRA